MEGDGGKVVDITGSVVRTELQGDTILLKALRGDAQALDILKSNIIRNLLLTNKGMEVRK